MSQTPDHIPAAVRRRIYPVALAAAALATSYGIVTEDRAGLWVALVIALVGTGTATAHRPEAQ